MDYLFSFTDYGEHIPELIPAAHGFSPIRKETTGKMECALTGRTDAAPRDSRADKLFANNTREIEKYPSVLFN